MNVIREKDASRALRLQSESSVGAAREGDDVAGRAVRATRDQEGRHKVGRKRAKLCLPIIFRLPLSGTRLPKLGSRFRLHSSVCITDKRKRQAEKS